MGYYDSLPKSFGQNVFVNDKGSASISNAKVGTDLKDAFANPKFGVDNAGQFSKVAGNLSGAGALAPSGQSEGWTFITAPEDVSWDIANKADRVDIFGTNNPPVIAGSKGMRDLTLNNSLVEGFVRNVTVESKITALEKLLNYGLNTSDGFVSVPVYQVWANNKSYGGAEAYYIIKDVKVKETMRDLKGDATRAFVDISLMQVPAYQVNTGRDQATPGVAGAGSTLKQDVATAANSNVAGPASKGGAPAGAAGTKPASGAGTPAPSPAITPRPQGQRFGPLPIN